MTLEIVSIILSKVSASYAFFFLQKNHHWTWNTTQNYIFHSTWTHQTPSFELFFNSALSNLKFNYINLLFWSLHPKFGASPSLCSPLSLLPTQLHHFNLLQKSWSGNYWAQQIHKAGVLWPLVWHNHLSLSITIRGANVHQNNQLTLFD